MGKYCLVFKVPFTIVLEGESEEEVRERFEDGDYRFIFDDVSGESELVDIFEAI